MGAATVRTNALLALAIGLVASALGVSVLAGSLASRPNAARVDRAATPTESPPHRTIEVQDDLTVVDFRQCTPERARIWVAFGSTTLAVAGREGDFCRLDYGGEVEDPTWDRRLTSARRIPAWRGLVTFTKMGLGIDLSSIQHYCTNID